MVKCRETSPLFINYIIMEQPIVKVEHLSHRYSVQWAIQDINFEIYEKGILGLLGSNLSLIHI